MPGAARRHGATEKDVVMQGMARPVHRHMLVLRKNLLRTDDVLTRVEGLADRLNSS